MNDLESRTTTFPNSASSENDLEGHVSRVFFSAANVGSRLSETSTQLANNNNTTDMHRQSSTSGYLQPDNVSESSNFPTRPVPRPAFQQEAGEAILDTATSTATPTYLFEVQRIRMAVERVENSLQEDREHREAHARALDENQAEERRALQSELAAVRTIADECVSRTSGGEVLATRLSVLEAQVASVATSTEALRFTISVDRCDREAADRCALELRDEVRAIREEMVSLRNSVECKLGRLELQLQHVNELHESAKKKLFEEIHTLIKEEKGEAIKVPLSFGNGNIEYATTHHFVFI